MARTSAVLLTMISLGSPVAVAQSPTPALLEANKKVVMEFYRPGITPEERYALIHKDYIQHDAAYVKYAKDHDISGNEAFRRIRLAQAPAGNTFHVLYAEGDTAVRIAQRWTPDPAAPGSYYETFFWDTFRVRNGKLVEHWDGVTLPTP